MSAGNNYEMGEGYRKSVEARNAYIRELNRNLREINTAYELGLVPKVTAAATARKINEAVKKALEINLKAIAGGRVNK